jgi:hypothetical protein
MMMTLFLGLAAEWEFEGSADNVGTAEQEGCDTGRIASGSLAPADSYNKKKKSNSL